MKLRHWLASSTAVSARSAVIVTASALAAQAVTIWLQMLVAKTFGASAALDGYLAGATIPQHVATVTSASLAFVLLPVFIDRKHLKDESDAWEVVYSVVALAALVLTGVALLGSWFRSPLIALSSPGLDFETRAIAERVALFMWPASIATSLASLLTGVYQARRQFAWPAVVPILSNLVNIGVFMAIVAVQGPVSLAIASLASALVQLTLLVVVILRTTRTPLRVRINDARVVQVARLSLPLLASGILIRATPVVERYLGSQFQAGSIANLGYASRILSLLTLVVATGIATVSFPALASTASKSDLPGVSAKLVRAMTLIGFVTIPIVIIGQVLAVPLVEVLLVRGKFTLSDAEVVGRLLRAYLWALGAVCVGNVTGRTFYALKDTMTPSTVGIVEAVAYIAYTSWLTNRFGILGVPVGFALYHSISVAWQLLVLGHKTKTPIFLRLLGPVLRTATAAAGGAAAAWGASVSLASAPAQLIVGALVGASVYVLLLMLAAPAEIRNSLGLHRRVEDA